MKLEETERRLNALYRKIEGETQTDTYSGTTDPSGNTEFGEQISLTPSTSEKLAHVCESQEIKPKAWAKVLGCCKIAEQFNISYVWIDTCCIDKDSSSELSESINSMFAWYRSSSLCIAYLSDVNQAWGKKGSLEGRPQNSVWFRRGWTLQELIAPKDVWFYNGDWTFLGVRSELVNELYEVTCIEAGILQWNGLEKLHSFSVAARMSWSAQRETTRPEDRAYSLLGIFGVNLPILYGEGEQNAFFRLQVMIFQTVSDHSIFAWKARALPWAAQ
ncbi:hypothetical protein BKA65DRAFT_414699 [Rhexocercosporidium sp. MPI-PUGE-AT-0058]|nr:hypothetical protein BKA65DRAFT_414699 [Rhexocercosporidium sp. MPI-PUGE-AT-0058]